MAAVRRHGRACLQASRGGHSKREKVKDEFTRREALRKLAESGLGLGLGAIAGAGKLAKGIAAARRAAAGAGPSELFAGFGPVADLPRDPYLGVRLENDVLGVRLWGPPTQPTLSLGKADIWDRRWYGDRQQPLITMARIRELAMADRLGELGRYDVYGRYDFPCPKPGAQLIIGAPFADRATVQADGTLAARLFISGAGKHLQALVWVAPTRHLVVIECETAGLGPEDLWLRICRHRDTIIPGQPLDPTIGGGASRTDFEPLPAPRCLRGQLGIAQDFPPEATFPDGFSFAAAASLDIAAVIQSREDEHGLGTPLWAEREGRLGHGLVKRYSPINEATGAASTARFREMPAKFLVLATIATSQDGPKPAEIAGGWLREAQALGTGALQREQSKQLRRGRRKQPARAGVEDATKVAAPPVVLPKLRHPRGYYGDVPLCSVDSTKFSFQDSSMWHGDFHLNEVRAEPMLALGQFEELMPYCEMIRTLLAQAQENAHDVYGLPGAMYPLAHFPLKCPGIAHTNVTWEQDLGLNGLVSKPLWLYYRYTGDLTFLRETAFPVLCECARFCAAYLTEEGDGRLHIVPTVSPEHWGLTAGFERNRDCLSALTLTKYLLRAAARAAHILGKAGKETAAWQRAADRLAPYPTQMTEAGPVWVDVAGAPPIEYNVPVPLSAIFWGDDVGLDSTPEVLALARRTLDQIRVWEPHRGYLDSCVRPRLGIWRPESQVGSENLLLSYQSIRVFPSVPPDVEVTIENFAAQGGFRVSARRAKGGTVEDVLIQSTLDGPCRVVNPWPESTVLVTDERGRTAARASPGDSHVTFAAERGAGYRLAARRGLVSCQEG